MIPQIHWRVEWHSDDILSAPTLSTGWAGVDGRPPTTHEGLSCCTSALGLAKYWSDWLDHIRRVESYEPDFSDVRDWSDRRWGTWREMEDDIGARRHRIPDYRSRVVAFIGRRLGTDIDGYPRVQPEMVLTESRLGTLVNFCCPWYEPEESACRRAEYRARNILRRRRLPTQAKASVDDIIPARVATAIPLRRH